MNRSFFALFVALLIHFLLLLIFWFLGTLAPETKNQQKPQENRIKVSLKEMIKKEKIVGDKNIIKEPINIAPPMPKGSQLKKIVTPLNEKPPLKYEPNIVEQKVTPQKLYKPELEPKPKIEPLPPAKPYIKMQEQEKKSKYDSLDWLSEDKSSEDVQKKERKQSAGSNIGDSDLKELYGDEFGKLTPGQQKYLLDNREIMRRITQEVLNRVAKVNITRDINVNTTNIVEFYLHPNGDMTDFKFLQKSGYYVLEDTTKETIEFAYSKYPRPNEKILVRYNVFYNLRH